METKGKIIVILGPTASGKSKLGVKLAKKLNGEIISADSRQVYKGLDIGTGKITKSDMKGVPHHLLDVANVKRAFSTMQYKKLANKAIKNILKKDKVPIVVGGTGFYIKTLVENISIPEVPPNKKLRKTLEQKSVAELYKILKKLDPRRAKGIDAKNPRRLVRAIEIVEALGKVPPLVSLRETSGYKFIQIGLKVSENELKKRIKKRIKKMLNPPTGGGLVRETEKLRNPPPPKGAEGGGISWKRIYELGFEYKYPALFLQGKIDKSEMLERLLIENWQYAKRQMTWFKKDKKIKWLTPSEIKGFNHF